ncbi:NYN domain-containing protein [Neochlamydia sp. S13]|uniref:NYN domain-containing protein n=1 Tax=Neochlamydia sp. S13 TaxID=1353976 RepID=UPI0005AB7B14|nr:NYN domain-containing protein [Neochlamydia sp. S13]BBI17997.1 Uncharacterized protein NCS13_1_1802 [Neochlamydia sp. S13]
MHYFIDGYNLMFRVLKADNELQAQREAIIQDLNKKIHLLGLQATIIFDAHHQAGESSRTHLQQLEIIFTSTGETADERILQELKHSKNPRQETIITSDKKLAWLARRRNARTETVEDFLVWLNARYQKRLKYSKQQASPLEVKQKSILRFSQKKTLLSKPLTSVEGCFEFYHQQFEISFQSMVNAHSIKKKEGPHQAKRDSKDSNRELDKGLTMMERWQKAFERDPSLDEI